MIENEITNKVFVYKLMISQLHHDGYNALALLMEQMLLSSKKVQPSDCLTQLLNVCKAVSFADKQLVLDEGSVVMTEEDRMHHSPDKIASPTLSTGGEEYLMEGPCKSEAESPNSTSIFSTRSLLEPAPKSSSPSEPSTPSTSEDPLTLTLPHSLIFSHNDLLSQISGESSTIGQPTSLLPTPSLLLPNTSTPTPLLPTSTPTLPTPTPLLHTSTPTIPSPTPLLPTSTPLRSLSTPILPTTNRFNPTILTHPYSFPLGRAGSLPFFSNLPFKDKADKADPDLLGTRLQGDLLGGRLQDVVKAFTAGPNPSFALPGSICNSWPGSLLSQVQSGHASGARQHKMKNCPVCNKMLVASSLYLHMKIHTGEKNYICEFCCKRFLLKHHLHSHLKICQSRTIVLGKKEPSPPSSSPP